MKTGLVFYYRACLCRECESVSATSSATESIDGFTINPVRITIPREKMVMRLRLVFVKSLNVSKGLCVLDSCGFLNESCSSSACPIFLHG